MRKPLASEPTTLLMPMPRKWSTIVSTQADRPCSLEMSGVMSLKMTPGSG